VRLVGTGIGARARVLFDGRVAEFVAIRHSGAEAHVEVRTPAHEPGRVDIELLNHLRLLEDRRARQRPGLEQVHEAQRLHRVALAFPLEPHHQARVVRVLLEVERLDVAQVPADLHALGLGRRLPRHAEQDHEADQPHTRDSGAPGRRRQSSLKVSVQPQSPRVPTADELARAIGKLLEHRHE
jgi:hypothetical protein